MVTPPAAFVLTMEYCFLMGNRSLQFYTETTVYVCTLPIVVFSVGWRVRRGDCPLIHNLDKYKIKWNEVVCMRAHKPYMWT